ncbi:selenide, water dikinase [Desulfomicrobium orale DSM 12838]|uniref:Selenide, water dikinase n=1 Tax=Desulfomicrobium orale DSM 12838 TaxID=888061 RepID=A0A0X8JN31_9BACT|nr:selenide, water dikinase [Desulfomicrobium orale DSM 12838]
MLEAHADPRILTGLGNAEDAAVVCFPPGKALVQTIDFLTPVVNDPFRFGQIAAANALSDVYAMGGEPYAVMNVVCFPAGSMDGCVLREILRGGLLKVRESGAMLVGGHSVQDREIKYGLSVSGLVDPDGFATNSGLRPGDRLVLTKPVGSGVLATAVKAQWRGADGYEEEIFRWAARLNRIPGEAITRFGLRAATDVTGFGLGGHLLEMLRASDCSARLHVADVPVMSGALELATQGLVPQGSHSNRGFCQAETEVSDGMDAMAVDIVFDAQTSGGLLLGVPEEKCPSLLAWLHEQGELAVVVGQAEAMCPGVKRLLLC